MPKAKKKKMSARPKETKSTRHEHEFLLGLAFSGGSTRGAYSAGVLDFLIEALSEWEKARKDKNTSVPPWTVRVTTMAGASAGGITAMLGLSSMTAFHQPLRRTHTAKSKTPKHNILYRGWVSDFQYDEILDISDLQPDPKKKDEIVPVRSLLNSNFLRGKADELNNRLDTNQRVPKWVRGVELYLTVCNMRGIPYSFKFDDAFNENAEKFHMLRHKDYVGFTTDKAKDPDLFNVDPNASRKNKEWQRIFDAAAATAAIAGVFPSIVLARPREQYKNREKGVRPDWKQGIPEEYRFNATDGGFLNNEPVDIVRMSMEKKAGRGDLNSSALHSWGSIILIDVNNNARPREKLPVREFTAVESLLDLTGALIDEAKFKDEDLLRALDDNEFAQHVISPVRFGKDEDDPHLATDTFNGFGGILDIEIRHHDFLLGRRNCQQFLRKHFVLPAKDAAQNPLFSKDPSFFKKKRSSIPIVPLFGTAAEECPMPKWPKYSRNESLLIQKKVGDAIYERLHTIITTYAVNLGILKRPAPWQVVSLTREGILKAVIRVITNRAFDRVAPALEAAMKTFD